jgi:dynein heavy chain
VKYLLLLDLDVPKTAQDLYARVDVYRQQTGNLELIVDMYNGMLEALLRVEKPLLKDRIERMSKALQPGIETLRWDSEGINPFINQAMKIVTDVDVLVAKMKQNVTKIETVMTSWRKPLFERRAKTAEPDLVATIHNAAVELDRDNIKGQGKEIQNLMKDTLDHIKPDKKGQAWLNYVDYVNSLIIDGVTDAINASMEYMADQINIKYNTQHMLAPIFEIGVELSNGDLCFHPTIECNDRQNGITDIINGIVDDFVGIAILIPRLDNQHGGASDFLVEIKDQFQLFGTMQEISANLGEITNASKKFLDQYRSWEFLWKEDVETSFNKFLASGPDLRDIYEESERAKILASADKDQDQEEFDNKMKYAMQCYDFLQQKIFKGVTTRQPDLAAFDKKIEFLHNVKNQIDGTTLVSNIGWLKVTTSSLVKKLYEKT